MWKVTLIQPRERKMSSNSNLDLMACCTVVSRAGYRPVTQGPLLHSPSIVWVVMLGLAGAQSLAGSTPHTHHYHGFLLHFLSNRPLLHVILSLQSSHSLFLRPLHPPATLPW